MDIRSAVSPSPEDVMHRLTDLSFRERFSWRSHAINLRTNSRAILSGAVSAGLSVSTFAGSASELIWEIVAEPPIDKAQAPLRRDIVRHAKSVYIGMGPYQWFAFDYELGIGAGFVTVDQFDNQADRQIALYLRAILEVLEDGFGYLPGVTR